MSGRISPDAVRDLAFQLWQERGGAGGSPEADWFRAEQMLSAGAAGDQVKTEQLDKAVEDSFPASDPPAISSNDEPPANAGAKWEAADDAKRKARRF